jgi:WhiB family redox-sensing transcriptional regulator
MADYSRLPGPNADVWDWQLRGLCRGKDSSLFFHPEGERGAARAAREQSAKEICLNCPVQKQCSEHALRVREPYGVWGGMTEEEREIHYQRQKALARARAVREKAALAEKAVLKEKMLREHELAKQAAEARRRAGEARAQSPAETARTAEPAMAAVPAELGSARSAPKKKTPVVAKPLPPRKRVAATKPAKQSPAKTAANSKKRTPAKV